MKKLLLTVLLAFTAVFSALGAVFSVSAETAPADPAAALFENVSHCDTIVGNQDFPAEYSKPGNGVKILGTASQATVRYKNVIDLSALDKDTNLIEFQILSKGYGNVFDCLYITLTDIYDASNTLRLRVKQQTWRTEFSMVAANWDGRWLWTLNYDTSDPDYGKVVLDPAESIYGTWIDTPFDASQLSTFEKLPLTDLNPATIRLDYATGCIYAGSKNELVVDTTDEAQIGYGTAWKKFTTGECTMEIMYENVAGSSGIIVSEIAGQELGGAVLTDTTAPVIKADVPAAYEREMPAAQKNAPYPLPAVRGLDVLDGAIEPALRILCNGSDITDTVRYKGENAIVPTRAGQYTLEYTAADASGKTAQKRFTFACEDSIALIGIEFAEPPAPAYIGDPAYYIPEFVTTGGSGSVDLQYTAYYNGRKLDLAANRYIELDEAGEIRILCTVRDYIGTLAGSAEEFCISVTAPDKPVLTVGGVPHSATKGKTLVLPDFTAVDHRYAEGDAQRLPEKKITVNGTDVTAARRYEVTENAGETLTVTYSAGGAEKSYSIAVIDPTAIEDYILCEDDVTVVDEGNSRMLYTELVSTGSTEYKLAQPVSVSYLVFGVAPVSNCACFDVVLEDYENGDTVFLRFTPQDAQNAYMQVNGRGVEYSVRGSFTDPDTELSIAYQNATRQISVEGVGAVCTVQETEDGKPFGGFASGGVRFTVRVQAENEGREAHFRFLRVGNQSFTMPASGAFRDRTMPQPYYFSGMQYRRIRLGESFTVSRAAVFDVLDCNAQISVSVTAPDGTKLLEKAACDQDYVFTGEQYGSYVIVYYLFDSRNNSETVHNETFNVFVADETPPLICVTSRKPGDIAFGGTIARPEYTVSDNVSASENCKTAVFVKDVSGFVTDITDEEGYTPAQKGTYYLYIFAYDEAYNSRITVFTVQVV